MQLVSSHHPRVLVAEDDPAMGDLLAEALHGAGLEAVVVPDGEALLSLAPGASVIVTDLRMPRLGGMEALARLRADGWDRPVVVITAFGSAELHALARALGAARVFDKPLDLDRLVEAVHQLLPTPR